MAVKRSYSDTSGPGYSGDGRATEVKTEAMEVDNGLPNSSLTLVTTVETPHSATNDSGSASSSELAGIAPYFLASFQQALTKGTKLAACASAVLQQDNISQTQNAGLAHIVKTASDLAAYQGPSSWKVGVLGDSGAGKSSLINNLLDEQLAQTGDQGEAVTSFVTEYRPRKAGQTSPFLVEADFFSGPALREQIKDLLWTYRLPHIPNMLAEMKADEYEEALKASSAALSNLEVAFGDQVDGEMLLSAEDGAFDRLSVDLINLALKLDWPEDANNGLWIATAEDAEECRERATAFMTQNVWPFVKIMRVFIHSDILNNGIILADVPGFHDVNYARVQAAKRYQSQCHEIFIVSPIKRVVTDTTVREIIDEVKPTTNDHQPTSVQQYQVSIICTYSCDINITTAPRHYRHLLDEEEVEEAKARVKATKGAQWEVHEEARLHHQLIYVTARNNEVRRKLLATFQHEMEPSPLEVFTVDNKFYLEGQIQLAKDMSGMAHLKRACVQKPAKSMYLHADNFLSLRLPTFAHALDFWLSSSLEQEMLLTIREMIRRAVNEARTVIDTRVAAIVQQAVTSIISLVKNHGATFDVAALDSSRQWDDLHWSSYKASCRRDGIFSSFGAGNVNWHADLNRAAVKVLQPAWKKLEKRAVNEILFIKEDIRTNLKKTIAEVQGLKAPRAITQALKTKQSELHLELRQKGQDFIKDFAFIGSNCLKPVKTAYIGVVMHPTYRLCAEDTGKGTYARSKQLIQDRLEQGHLFSDIADMVQSEVEEVCANIRDSIHSDVDEFWQAVDADLQLMEDAGESAELLNAEPEFKKRLVKLVAECRETLTMIEEFAAEAREEANRLNYYDH